jgi:Cell wall binding domain 2 (CWB2)
MRAPPLRLLAVLALGATAAGCGKTGPPSSGEASGTAPAVVAQGAVGVVTKNTTRLGGADPASDAAAVARAVYPGLTAAARPRAVVLVDEHDQASALAASALAAAPLGAPLLYGESDSVPAVTADAIRALRPTGAAALGGAQVIRVGTTAAVPEWLRTRAVPSAGGAGATGGAAAASAAAVTAIAVERLLELVRGGAPRRVIVLAADASPALQMPAAGLSAESGAPILFVTASGVPAATAAELRRLHRPDIYLVAPAAVDSACLAALARLGHITPITESATPAEAAGPVTNANAVARFTDGSFGWGVKEPGHGLVFASAARPFDAPAGALLSASGDYGPLLLLEGPHGVPAPLARYLSDIQPAYGEAPQYQPVHGSYNHGWLIGDEQAISSLTQAELDSMLEIAPRHVSSEEEPAISPAE